MGGRVSRGSGNVAKPPEPDFPAHKDGVRDELRRTISEKVPVLLAMPRETAVVAMAESLRPFRPLSIAEVSGLLKPDGEPQELAREDRLKLEAIINEALVCQLPEGRKKPDKAMLARKLGSMAHSVVNVVAEEDVMVASMESALEGFTRNDLAMLADAIGIVSARFCMGREEVLRLRELAYIAVLGHGEAESILELHTCLAELDIQMDRRFYALLADWASPSFAIMNVEDLVGEYGPGIASNMIKNDPRMMGLTIEEIRRFEK